MKIRIGRLFFEVLPAFLFFLIMFHVLALTRIVTLREYGINPHASFTAFIGALVIAKVVIITDKIPFLNLYPKKPLIWNVILKTIVFGTAALLFFLLEALIHQARIHGSFSAGYQHMGTDVVWPVFWVYNIWINILLFLYCMARECVIVVGVDKMKEILFGRGK